MCDYTHDLVDNPWGCYGQTDYPHASNSKGTGVVNVHARTVCPNNFTVPELGPDGNTYGGITSNSRKVSKCP